MTRGLKRTALWLFVILMLGTGALAGEEATDFKLDNGLTVIYLRDPGNPVVNLNLVIPGTALRQTVANAGIEQMTMELLIHGSKDFDKQEFNRRLDRTSAHIGSSVEKDASTFSMGCVLPFFDQTLELFASAWRRPLFDAQEIELVRQQQLAAIRAKYDSPDSVLVLKLNETFNLGHPYLATIEGSLDSVAGISEADIREHHALLLRQAGAFIVVVGDIEPEVLKTKLNAAFGDLRLTMFIANTLPDFVPPKGEVLIENMPLPTRYILAKFLAPNPGDPSYPALDLATHILATRLWESVRTEQGLAYAVHSSLGKYLTNFGYLYLSTGNETAAMRTIFDEMARLKSEPVPAEELAAAKAVFETEYYMSVETPGSQASRLADGVIYLNDYTRRHQIVSEIKALSADDVKLAAERWFGPMTFMVLGDAATINRAAFSPVPPAAVNEGVQSTKEEPK